MVITTGLMLTLGTVLSLCAVSGGLRPLPSTDQHYV